MTVPTSDVRVAPGLTWDGFSAGQLAQRCAANHLELFAEVGSTLDIAHARAAAGAPAGAVFLADSQTAGRGRFGRSWSSEPGGGVWMTFLARPTDRSALDVLSLRVGLYLAEALEQLTAERVGVKWPNDLVRRGRKLAGILAEARWSGPTLGWVAIGVGVNVRPPHDVDAAAGLERVARVHVLEGAVRAIRRAADAQGALSGEEVLRYAQRDALRGVRVVSPGDGTVVGIDASGALLIDTARGTERYRAGTIRLAEDP